MDPDDFVGEIFLKNGESFSLQVWSDLHLEWFIRQGLLHGNPWLTGPPSAPYLCLLGDTISLWKKGTREIFIEFLEHICPRFKNVFYVFGNHEYFNYEFDEAEKKTLEILQRFNNIHVLNQKSFLIHFHDGKKIRLLGTTLWSHVEEAEREMTTKRVCDYRVIHFKDRKFTVDDSERFHLQQVQWLEYHISNAKENGETLVVLTHHAPITKNSSNPKYGDSHSGFSTDLSRLLGPPILFWGFGHTHWLYDKIWNGTQVLSNSKGYVSESIPWDPFLYIEFAQQQQQSLSCKVITKSNS